MKAIVFDTETTTHEKGNPFSKKNFLVTVQWRCTWKDQPPQIVYYDQLWEAFLEDLEEAEWVVGFNLKFDLHWLRRLKGAAQIFQTKKLWDCQLAEYILSRQKWRYPDLNQASINYGGPPKDTIIETEYWSKGIDTHLIPRDVLTKYAIQDITCTEHVFVAQQRRFRDEAQFYPIFRLSSADELVLEEMESNGIKFNVELCSARLQEVDRNLADVSGRLSTFVTSVDDFDWASGDELSALLFGGYVVREEEYQDGRYKTGAKAGLPKIRKREVKIKLDGYYVPDPRWEVKKTKDKSDYDLENEGKWRVYKSNDDILSLVKDKIGLVELLKEQARLTKLREYYVKLLTLPQQKDWERDMLHGQFNQVVTATGRSSSSDPNLQNFAGDIQDVFVTRY